MKEIYQAKGNRNLTRVRGEMRTILKDTRTSRLYRDSHGKGKK